LLPWILFWLALDQNHQIQRNLSRSQKSPARWQPNNWGQCEEISHIFRLFVAWKVI
jgi:hypothetical protein